MNVQEDLLQTAGESFEYANQYLQKQFELLKLEGAERVAKTTSAVVTLIVLAFLATMVFIMFSIAIGFWLGQLLDSYALAFLSITGAYVLLGLIVFFFKKQLVTNPILTAVLQSFFD